VKNLILYILAFCPILLLAQPNGNEWIDYNQRYYKFPIVEEGIYRITYQDLQSANIPLSTIQPSEFRIHAKGIEIPIYIPNESDNSFDPSDFIEFYAKGNDGWLDTVFYGSRSQQPNPYYSLINDTLFYFLSWGAGSNQRYQEYNEVDFNNYFAASYVWKESISSFNNLYYDGRPFNGGATSPYYTPEEGWMGPAVNLGQSRNITMEMFGHINSGPPVEMEAKIAGASNPSENPDHHLEFAVSNYSTDTIFEGYQLIEVNRSIPASNFFDGNNTVNFRSIDDLNASTERTAPAYIKLTYPRRTNFSSRSSMDFLVEDNANQSASLLEITAFNGGSQPILYDLSNRRRIRVVQTLQNYKAIVPNSGGRKRCFLINPNQVKSISSLRSVSISGRFTDYSSRIIDSTFIILTHPSLFVDATTYAAYRRSQGRTVEIVQVTDLYDQYAYGIPSHPLAIRNFIQEGLNDWAFSPTHLLLLGKSVGAKSHRKSVSAQAGNLVPTMGNPPADNLLVSGLNSPAIVPAIPLGRVSARSGSEVDIYLDKLIEYESAPKEKWMKEALNFAGGRSEGEANQYVNYLNSYAQDFQGQFFGGRARLFRKSSSAPFQTSLADSVRTLINSGVSIMTFFGHASANDGFDISIDTPDKLENRGKYPLMLANSCFTGNYHQASSISTGEDYVLERNKGAIAYIATGNLGYAFYLNQYSGIFYDQLTRDFYGESIAEVMRQTSISISQGTQNDQRDRVSLEMSLQGDPAVALNFFPQVDYQLDQSNLFISPNEITTELDSFKVRVFAENLGKAENDTVIVTLRRSFPTSSKDDTTYVREIQALYYEQLLEFTLPIDPFEDIGANDFAMSIDPFDQIQEASEMNNQINFTVLIRSGEITPIYPYDQAIIGAQDPKLYASTAYVFEELKSYVFELDTDINFNSPNKESATIASIGGALSWEPTSLQNMSDSAVYYWRVSKQPAPGEQFNWKTRSFQYIPNRNGWSQSDFDQFNKNNFLFIKQNNSNEQFEFTDNVKELNVFTKSSPSLSEAFAVRYSIDADVRERNACGARAGFLIAVLDSLDLESWESPYNGENPNNYFGQANFDNYCGTARQRTEKYFLFRQSDTSQMRSMRDFLLNSIPDGNFIVVYTWQNVDYSQIRNQDPTILAAFNTLGSQLIDSLNDEDPYIFTCKKGDLSSVQEVRGFTNNDAISLSRDLVTSADFGIVSTGSIGSSNSFEKLYYHVTKSESTDSVSLFLYGSRNNGKARDLIWQSTDPAPDSALDMPIGIDQYSELNLSLRVADELNQTAPQLNFWQIFYQIYPELAFAPNVYYSVASDTLQRGQDFQFELAYINPTNEATDSILISYRVQDASGQLRMSQSVRMAPLAAFQHDTFKVSIPTSSLSGFHRLFLELNPANDQEEQYGFNNVADYNFIVKGDLLNPLMDVTFDGRRIMNRELVSAKPEIVMQLQDDNQFLALDDTSSFTIYLRRPNGQEELVNFSENSRISFTPASLPENKARVVFNPELSVDGIYQLRVSARDKSGNELGQQDYAIEFEVINRSTVSYLLNYPNPFSTSTRFVFTLTGSEVPDQIQIQIMTITGKVVKHIDQFELGSIHIGKNITDYAWDGKDDYGDQLANGVYLYRVKMKINGNSIEHRNTAVDKYFTEDFGKMYLLR